MHVCVCVRACTLRGHRELVLLTTDGEYDRRLVWNAAPPSPLATDGAHEVRQHLLTCFDVFDVAIEQVTCAEAPPPTPSNTSFSGTRSSSIGTSRLVPWRRLFADLIAVVLALLLNARRTCICTTPSTMLTQETDGDWVRDYPRDDGCPTSHAVMHC
jgi:hypothetical protein